MRWKVVGMKVGGAHIEETVEAESEDHAAQGLKGRGISIVSIIPLASVPGHSRASRPPTAKGVPAPAAPPARSRVVAAKEIFVSHSSRDVALANGIAAALEAAGVTCWIAPRDIPAGSDWNHQIMTALQNCKALLLLCSRHSVDSDPVKREVERAVARGVPVVPIWLERAKLPPSMEFMISTYHWIDAYPPPASRHAEAIIGGVKRALGASAIAPPVSSPDAEEKWVEKYRLLEPIGEGGMGTVYRAEQREPVKRVVAFKVVKAGFDTAEVIARFESERQALARMNHPHIAQVLDAGTTKAGRPFFAMEYVPGTSITKFADTQKLSIRDRLVLFLQVCDAIAHAHSKAIIHRDIKAGNVLAYLADGKPTAKVIDFGVAKALTGEGLSDHTLHTGRGIVVGTYAHMSPEQAEGSADVDTRCDVYSLGSLLYEMLTGVAVLDAHTLSEASDEEVRRMICDVEPARPSTRLRGLGDEARTIASCRQSKVDALSRELRDELEWIPLMAMRKDRQRRYASPLLLAEDIQNYLHARPLMAGPETQWYRFQKYVRRNRGVLATVIAVLIAVSTAVEIHIRHIRAEEQKTALARDEARKQQHIATTVNRFLTSLLTSADPKRGAKSLTDAVANFDDRLGDELKDEPDVLASVRDTIGDTQRALQDTKGAIKNLAEALRIFRGRGADGPEVAKVLDHTAHLQKDQLVSDLKRHKIDGDVAEKLFKDVSKQYAESIALFESSAPYDGRELDLANAYADRGSLFVDYNRNAKLAPVASAPLLVQADSDYAEALRLRNAQAQKGKLRTDGEEVLQAMNGRVSVLTDQRRFVEAEPVATAAVILADRSFPHDEADSRFQSAKLALARARLTRGNLFQAESKAETDPGTVKEKLIQARDDFRETLKYDRQALLADHPAHPYLDGAEKALETCLNDLAKALGRLNDTTAEKDTAEELARLHRESKERIDRIQLPNDGKKSADKQVPEKSAISG